jgi:hypothetical protein
MASSAARVVGMSMTSARHALSSKITTEGRNRINTNARRLPSPRMDGHKFLGGRYFHDLGEVAGVLRCRSGGKPRAPARRGCVAAHLPKVATGRADGRRSAALWRMSMQGEFACQCGYGYRCRACAEGAAFRTVGHDHGRAPASHRGVFRPSAA